MVHSLAGLNPTLPAWIGRVGPTANPIQNCPHNARTFETMWIFPPAMCVFLLGAAAVARGRIRKSQRNQSFKRYATAVRRKDLRGMSSPGTIHPKKDRVTSKFCCRESQN